MLAFVLRTAGGCALGLLLLNLVGLYYPPITQTAALNEKAVAGYHIRLLPLAEAKQDFFNLLQTSNETTVETRAKKLFNTISNSYLHSDQQYSLKPWDNWFLWLRAQLARDSFEQKMFLDPHNEEILWNRGGGFCHQAAWIFAEKARALGLRARLVKLPGHYLTEIEIAPDIWHVFDIDTGFNWDTSLNVLSGRHSKSDFFQIFKKRGFSHKRALALANSYPATDNPLQIHRRGFLYTRAAYIAALNGDRCKWMFPLIVLAVWISFELYRRHKRRLQCD